MVYSLYYLIPYHIIGIVLVDVILHYFVSNSTILYHIIPYHTILYHIVLHIAIPDNTILYHIGPYHTIRILMFMWFWDPQVTPARVLLRSPLLFLGSGCQRLGALSTGPSAPLKRFGVGIRIFIRTIWLFL